MSNQAQIDRIRQAKSGIKTAIENKGVSVPEEALIDQYPEFVNQIQRGYEKNDLIPPENLEIYSDFAGNWKIVPMLYQSQQISGNKFGSNRSPHSCKIFGDNEFYLLGTSTIYYGKIVGSTVRIEKTIPIQDYCETGYVNVKCGIQDNENPEIVYYIGPYIGLSKSGVLAFNPKQGTKLWEVTFAVGDGGCEGALNTHNNCIYVSNGNNVFKLNKSNGSEVTRVKLGSTRNLFCDTEGYVYVDSSSSFYRADPDSLSKVWTVSSLETQNWCEMVEDNDYLYIACYSSIKKVQKSSGSVVATLSKSSVCVKWVTIKGVKYLCVVGSTELIFTDTNLQAQKTVGELNGGLLFDGKENMYRNSFARLGSSNYSGWLGKITGEDFSLKVLNVTR
ncbi:MAG: hypothetical protein ACOX6P_11530 [Candidatus Merdivicinus sp.]|jgi:hypothetical protein